MTNSDRQGRAGHSHRMRRSLQPGDRNLLMRVGETVRGESVRELIGQYGNEIDSAASDSGVDPGLIRAIIYEEQTHLLPIVETDVAERLGVGHTVGLGQVSEGLHGFTREQPSACYVVTADGVVIYDYQQGSIGGSAQT